VELGDGHGGALVGGGVSCKASDPLRQSRGSAHP
jgi:hypothetical protein